MSHTKEPWYVEQAQNKSDFLVSTDDFQIARVIAHPVKSEAEANARRIVACINACAGIDTGLLERVGGIYYLVEQRDKLLSICRSVVDNGIGFSDVNAMKEIIAESDAA